MARTDLAKEIKSIPSQEIDFMKPLLQAMLQELLEEMHHALGASSCERNPERQGCPTGYYLHQWITRACGIGDVYPQRSSWEIFYRAL